MFIFFFFQPCILTLATRVVSPANDGCESGLVHERGSQFLCSPCDEASLNLSPPRFRSLTHPLIIPNCGPRSHHRKGLNPSQFWTLVYTLSLPARQPSSTRLSWATATLSGSLYPEEITLRPRGSQAVPLPSPLPRPRHFLTSARKYHNLRERVSLG